MSKSEYQSFIGRPEVSFWFPIIFTAVSISTSFMLLSNRVDLLSQKMEQILVNQQIIIDKYDDMQIRLGQAERQISVLQERITK
jgi:hypothetical protein